MPRDFWKTPGGKAEAAAESKKGVVAFQSLRDQRRDDAIALYDDGKGLDVNAIAKKLRCHPRTVKRYLHDAK